MRNRILVLLGALLAALVTIVPTAGASIGTAANPVARTATAAVGLNRAATDVVAHWPDASNTGVPAGGIKLVRTGNRTITQPGRVIDGLELRGCLTIVASNVVIRNSRIICGNAQSAVHQTSTATGLLIENSELIGAGGGNHAGSGIYSSTPYTARHVEIRGFDDGAFLASGTVFVHNWVHSLAPGSDAHQDLLQMVGGSDVLVVHNRLSHRADQTSGIMIKADVGPISNVLIADNLIAGGYYSVYVYAGAHGAPRNVTVRGNVITRWVYGAIAVQGPNAIGCNIDPGGRPVVYYDSDQQTNGRLSPC
ncbi:MAG: hypothetical protein S0880_13795 [Actinomycetota bacterium]|nr:hypothetical protein [Actinomycetota bacterium]